MTNAELIACIEAEERGEAVEFRPMSGRLRNHWRREKVRGWWDTTAYEYRVRPRNDVLWAVVRNSDGSFIASSVNRRLIDDIHRETLDTRVVRYVRETDA